MHVMTMLQRISSHWLDWSKNIYFFVFECMSTVCCWIKQARICLNARGKEPFSSTTPVHAAFNCTILVTKISKEENARHSIFPDMACAFK